MSKKKANKPFRVHPSWLFLDHLESYEDFQSASDVLDFSKWPHIYFPKAGGWRRHPVATVDISWTELLTFVEAWINQQPSEQEKAALIAHAKQGHFDPINLHILRYLLEHLPKKLDTALHSLLDEARQFALTTIQDLSSGETDGELAERLSSSERKAIITRLKQSALKNPNKRGQPSQWTADTLRQAIVTAVSSLKAKYSDAGKMPARLTTRLVNDELKRLHPMSASKSAEGFRKMISRFYLTDEWESLKRDWKESPKKPDTNSRSSSVRIS